MATIDDHMRQLGTFDLLRAAPEDAISDLARLLEAMVFEPGEVIISPQAPVRDVFLVTGGQVRLFHWGPDG